jgi:hypothetical protein
MSYRVKMLLFKRYGISVLMVELMEISVYMMVIY